MCFIISILIDSSNFVIILYYIGGCPVTPSASGLAVIPSSYTSIAPQAFFCCISLITLVIPSSVTVIGSQAFQGCHSLVSVSYYYGTSVGADAFDQTGIEGSIQITVIGDD